MLEYTPNRGDIVKVISISKKKFENLNPVLLPKDLITTEGQVFEFNYRGEQKALKKLYITEGKTFANKLYTLEMLDVNKKYLPNSLYIPDYLCSINGQVEAFTIPKIDGTNLTEILKSNNYTFKEQLFYLKRIGEILQQLHHMRKYTPLMDFYINDLHEGNFIVDNYSKELKVIDIDSCKIGTNDPSASKYLTSQLIKNCQKYKVSDDELVIADSNTDMFCYCIVILNYLTRKNVSRLTIEEFYNVLNHLDIIGLDKELIDIFYKLIIECKNENPVNYIQTITEKQIVKSRMQKTTI